MTTSSPTSRSANALDMVRRGNLARILRAVRADGPIARAALTRATGLNRSTVGALIAELHALGLVVEGPPAAATAVGRPSPIVRATPTVAAFAVNPEIDAITVALIGLDGSELGRVRRGLGRVPTADEAVVLAAEMMAEMAAANDGSLILGAGVAVPGITRSDDGLVRVAPHLGWVDQPFAQRLAEETGLTVSAGNDAMLGVDAEWQAGSARGVDDVVYLNGGASGIGGGIVSGGRVLGGFAGYAGELGHTLVDPGGARCHCGSVGCLETVVSQAALLVAAGVAPDPDDRLAAEEQLAEALARTGTEPGTPLGDEVARQLAALAIALRNIISTLTPELIVLGGFLGRLYEHDGPRLNELVAAQTMPVLFEGVTIATATLGSSILLQGAANLVFAPLMADPVGRLAG